MATRITKIFRAKPFPVRNPGIVPNRPRLLECLFEQGYDVGCEDEIGEMDHQKQFPIDNDIVNYQYSTDSHGVTHQREEILYRVDPAVRHGMLISIDKVNALHEQRCVKEYIQYDDETDQQSARYQNSQSAGI